MPLMHSSLRWQAISAVVFAHILLLMLWPSPMLPPAAPPSKKIMLLNLLAVKHVRAVPVTALALVGSTKFSKSPTLPARSSVTPLSPSATAPAQTSVTAPELASDGITTPLLNRDVRQISQDLQRAYPVLNQFPAKPAASSFQAFEHNVAAAGIEREMTTQNFIMADGTPMTKVTTSRGSYCVVGRKPGATETGREPNFRTVTCGNY